MQHELESIPARPSGSRLEHGQDAGRVLQEEGCLDFVEPVNNPVSLGATPLQKPGKTFAWYLESSILNPGRNETSCGFIQFHSGGWFQSAIEMSFGCIRGLAVVPVERSLLLVPAWS